MRIERRLKKFFSSSKRMIARIWRTHSPHDDELISGVCMTSAAELIADRLLCTITRRANQILINGAHIVVDRRHRLYVDRTLTDRAIQQQIETIRVARSDEQSGPVFMQPRLDNVVMGKNISSELRRLIAPNQDLHRVLFHLVAHAGDV